MIWNEAGVWVKTLDYSIPEQQPERKPFFARPFWRDWLLGGTLFLIGVLIVPSNLTDNWFPSYALIIVGALILLCAAIHYVLAVLCRWWNADDP